LRASPDSAAPIMRAVYGGARAGTLGRVEPRALLEELARPAAWPEGRAPTRMLETHISWLFFVGERVYKLKKSVDLGFLDYRALDARRHFCEEEVRLNRRLAPRVYLGVAAVCRDAAGRLRVGEPNAGPAGPSENVEEWAVVMHRLPAERMLSALVERGEVDSELLERLARRLAEFHRAAARGPQIDAHGAPEAVARNARDNFATLGGFGSELVSPVLLGHLAARAEAFLEERRDLLERRVCESRVCEGHGDLHAENVCVLPDEIVAYDGIEFSAALRCGDVACDLAFLTMDLDFRGFPAFARDLARRYAAHAGDGELEELLGFYEDYRALVRAKVAGITAAAPGASPELARQKGRELRRYLHLACRRSLGPGLVLCGGLPASGKSTLARHLAGVLDAAHLESDVRRKRLAGLAPDARVRPGVDQGLYAPESRAHTYASLLESAEEWLAEGRRVVVDATFAARADRAAFVALARRRRVPWFLCLVHASEERTRARLAARAADPHAASDADSAVWEKARERFEPPDELSSERVLACESEARALEEEAGALLEAWIGGAHPGEAEA